MCIGVSVSRQSGGELNLLTSFRQNTARNNSSNKEVEGPKSILFELKGPTLSYLFF